VREQEWQVIADLSQALIEQHGIESLSDKQRYWRGHALQELGDPVAAHQQWLALAQERSFYGFMSADLTGLEYHLNHQAIDVDDIELQELASLKGIKRLREWLLLGEPHKANLEWLLVKDTLSQRQRLTAARLAEVWHEPNLAIQATIAARYWNDIALRFPLHYRHEIGDVTTDLSVDDSLVMSLARQESAFNEKARSPVGALGLMQLMPSTARSIAKTLGMKISSATLLDGDTNLTLGSHYLDTLVTRYAGNTVLAAAAYNAGPYRVDQWLEEAQNCQRIDTWIESIPYNETRQYVQNVLTYRVIYNKLMGRPARLMQASEIMLGAAPVLASMAEQPSEKTNL
jgi:soluble lytic murein transglycosylase